MDIDAALAGLGAGADTLDDSTRGALDDRGYAAFPGLLDPATISEVRAALDRLEAQEDAWGAGTHERDQGAVRVDDVNHKDEAFDRLWSHPVLMAVMYHYLGDFRLSSMTARAARPGTGHQRLHSDYWGEYEERYAACNSGWLLDDFSAANGATRVIPGTHHLRQRPEDVLEDVMAEHPDQVLVEAPAGSLIVFNGYLWHGGTLNTTDRLRRGVFTVYSRRDLARQNDQAARLEPATAERLSPAQRYILDA